MPEQQPSSTPRSENSTKPGRPPVKQENMFLNLGFNLALPIMILNKGERWFGGFVGNYFENIAVGVMLIAIAFPIAYFVYDYLKRAKFNLLSILGLLSVLLTGMFGVLKLPVEWFPIKEASIPLILGVGVIASNFTRNSFFKAFILNPDICDVPKIEAALKEHHSEAAFDKLIKKCNWLMAASFLISSVLNYVIAEWIVVSPTGTEAFNAEVGKMMGVSWIAIAIPSMALMLFAMWMLLSGVHKLTGLKLEEVLHSAKEDS
ncbi:MAG: VC0807 family protein [Coraliomargarita sp.]